MYWCPQILEIETVYVSEDLYKFSHLFDFEYEMESSFYHQSAKQSEYLYSDSYIVRKKSLI